MSEEISRFLNDWQGGDQAALERLLPLVYPALKRIAARCFEGEAGAATLQPTALVNEAWMQLSNEDPPEVRNRSHFFALAARIMRNLLVDHARRRRLRANDGAVAMTWISTTPSVDPIDLIALDDALAELHSRDARQAQVVELRFFGSLEIEEIASVLGVSRPTVERDWSTARAWLGVRLRGKPSP